MKKKIVMALMCAALSIGMVLPALASQQVNNSGEVVVISANEADEADVVVTLDDGYENEVDDVDGDNSINAGIINTENVDDADDCTDDNDTGANDSDASDESDESYESEESDDCVEEDVELESIDSDLIEIDHSEKPTEDDSFGGRAVIIGFSDFNANKHKVNVKENHKPSLNELKAKFPKTIQVELKKDGEVTTDDISVTWDCIGDDYETSHGFYFQFSPKWDESDYKLASALDVIVDAPYIPVYVIPEEDEVIAEEGAGSNGTIVGVGDTVDDNKEYIFNYITGPMGLNTAAACGIMANIQYESGFKTTIYGDNGTSYGLCQWHNNRFANLRNFCANNGLDYTSVEGQMRFLQHELENSYKSVLSHLQDVSNTADGAYDAGYHWCVYFEVPADRYNRGKTRGNLARDTYWPKYKDKSSDPIKPPSPVVSKTYNITYVLNGGTNNYLNPDTRSTQSGNVVLMDPTREGFDFGGWYLDATCISHRITVIPKDYDKDVTVYAKWIPHTYTIKFYGNGSTSGSMSAMKKLKCGKAYTLKANKFKRKNYTFDGWNTKKDGTGASYEDKESIKNLATKNNGVVKLYAQWSDGSGIKYTIKFNGNGATKGSMKRMTKVSYEEDVVLRKNNFRKSGYKFVGWNTKKNGKGDMYIDEEIVSKLCKKNGGTITLYAQWKKR